MNIEKTWPRCTLVLQPWVSMPCPVSFVSVSVEGFDMWAQIGSFWQWIVDPNIANIEARGGLYLYCIQMESPQGNGFILDPTQLLRLNMVEHFTRRAVDLFQWRSPAVDWHSASHANLRLFKHYRLESGKESKRLSLEKFISRLCNKMSKACPGKIHGGRWRDVTWVAPLHQEGYVVIILLISFMAGQPTPPDQK